jgi:hypothetical protein
MGIELNTPLKYHMNDLIYYLGISSGGNLGKQIALLGAIAAMAKGMLYRFNAPQYKDMQEELDEFASLVDMLDKAYNPMIDSNPYLFPKARRIRKGVHIAEVLAYSIIEKHNLVSGNIMRARLVDAFGKERIKREDDYE